MPSLRDATRTAGYAYAAGINRDRSYVLNEAVAAYLEMYQLQIEEIQKGITEADVRDFASDEEVKATFAKLTNNAD